MRKIWAGVLFLGFYCADPIRGEGDGQAPVPGDGSLPVHDFGFPVGEELIYKIYWGFIPVGKTRIVTRWIEEDGRRLLAIRYRTRSNRVIATLYPVDDLIESIIDPATFLPVRFVKDLKEGRHRYHEVTYFDHAAGLARMENRIKNREKVYPIDPDTRDLVSFMYFMRSHRFQPGIEKQFRVMADEKIYDLFVKACKTQNVRIKHFGGVRSIRLEPEAQFQGLFVRKGKLTVWVSDDERGLCTKVVGSVPVVDIKVLLWEVRGPGDDDWIRKTREFVAEGGDEADPEVDGALQGLDEEPVSR